MPTMPYAEFQARHGQDTTLPYAVERVTTSYLALPPQIDLYVPAWVTPEHEAQMEEALVLRIWRDPEVRLFYVEDVPAIHIGAAWRQLNPEEEDACSRRGRPWREDSNL